MRWMKLEPVIQSDVNWKKKNKYCILIHIYEIQKEGTGEPLHRAAMETQTQKNRLMDQGGEEDGEVETNGESSMDAYTLTYVYRQPKGICCMPQGTQTRALK